MDHQDPRNGNLDPSSARPTPRETRRLAKPSPALVISIIALFFALSGFGMAAKNQITGKDIKDGSITARDIAKGAIKAKHLAKRAVKAKAIAPKAVLSTALAKDAVRSQHIGVETTLCPNGTIVYGRTCPAPPQRYAVATEVEMTDTFSGPAGTCYFVDEVSFDTLSAYPDLRNPWGPSSVIQIKDPAPYDVTITAAWEEGAGSARIINVSRHVGSGPHEGQHYTLERVVTTPVTGEETTQSLRFTSERLEQSDELTVMAASCGDDVELKKLTINVEPNFGR